MKVSGIVRDRKQSPRSRRVTLVLVIVDSPQSLQLFRVRSLWQQKDETHVEIEE